ncbi:MAG: hypothetical protein JRI91_00910 [Deltaproteobacteria bacterium]|nr:hypothetical protein [Deltaproteobacteria bacterium]
MDTNNDLYRKLQKHIDNMLVGLSSSEYILLENDKPTVARSKKSNGNTEKGRE